MPALLASLIALYTSSLGGSIIAISPTKVKSTSSSSTGTKLSSSTSFIANANTLNALFENSSFIFLYEFNISSFISTVSPSTIAYLHLLNTTSGAPFVNIYTFPCMLFTVDISFLSLSNGISFNLLYLFLKVS